MCFIRYLNADKWLKKRAAAEFFLTNFKVFRYRMKHPFECLIELLKPLTILGENQSKSSPNFTIIKITYPNLLHCCNFLCFFAWIINEFEKRFHTGRWVLSVAPLYIIRPFLPVGIFCFVRPLLLVWLS